jgi:DNA ligase 4
LDEEGLIAHIIIWQDDDCSGTLTIHEVNSLLDQLASLSRFSHDSIRAGAKRSPGPICSRSKILRRLFSSISPVEASFLTQIILKDLRPILYPVVETHYTAALQKWKSNAVVMLTVPDALKAWDPSCELLKKWKLVSCFEEALNYNEDYSICVFTPLQVLKLFGVVRPCLSSMCNLHPS